MSVQIGKATLLSIFFFLIAANAVVVQKNPRGALPGYPVIRQLPISSSSGLINFSTISSSNAPTASASATTSPLESASVGQCTPSSICFDGFACSLRYGGCYDQNFCNGTSLPFPTPTCSTFTGIPGFPGPTDTPAPALGPVDDDEILEEEEGDGTAMAVVAPG